MEYEARERLLGQTLAIAPLEDNPDIYRFSCASEYPVRIYGGEEILVHSREAINLERLPGMVMLWEHGHDSTVGSEPLGRVVNWEISRGKSYCDVRWANTELAKKYRQLVDDGIVTNVSIRYQPEEMRPDPSDYNRTLVTKYTIVHVSLVSDPADPSVGYGRSYSYKSTVEGTAPLEESELQTTPKGEIMEDQEQTAVDYAAIREEESTRVRSIAAMGAKHGFDVLAEQLIDGGKSVEEARAVINRQLEERNNQQPLSRASQGADLPSFGKNEDKQYSLLTAIRSICPGFAEYQKNCFEREVSQEIGQKIGRTTAGVFVPVRHLTVNRNTRDRDALTTAGTPSNLIQTDLLEQDFIEALRNKAMVFQLGARFLTGLMGPVEIPKQTATSTAYWVNENQSIPDTDVEFGQIGMSQKTVASIVSMTRNLAMQSSISVENIVRDDMVKQIALAIDAAAINGSGVGATPKGILNYNINSVPLGNDGAAPTYASLVAMCAEIEADNADVSAMKFLTNSRVKSKLMLTPMQSSGVEGNFVLKEGSSTLMGYDFNVSNQIPSNLTKGNGTNLSAIILGCFDQLIVGEWGVLEILPNTLGRTYASGGVEIRAIKSMDLCLRHEQAFAAITDAVTTL